MCVWGWCVCVTGSSKYSGIPQPVFVMPGFPRINKRRKVVTPICKDNYILDLCKSVILKEREPVGLQNFLWTVNKVKALLEIEEQITKLAVLPNCIDGVFCCFSFNKNNTVYSPY